MKFKLVFSLLLALAIPGAIFAEAQPDGKSSALKNAVILIIRHAEKPPSGYNLTPAGEARANAYANYFKTFTLEGQPLKVDYLFATADTKGSHRPRLTLEPTSKALGLAIDSRFKDNECQQLSDNIRATPHGQHILICWHHGKIPELVQDLGGDAGQLFSKGKWPDAVFNWVIEMRYDADGHLVEAKRIVEPF